MFQKLYVKVFRVCTNIQANSNQKLKSRTLRNFVNLLWFYKKENITKDKHKISLEA